LRAIESAKEILNGETMTLWPWLSGIFENRLKVKEFDELIRLNDLGVITISFGTGSVLIL